MHSYLRAFRHYADFRGRTGRSDYWYFMLFNFLIGFSLEAVETVADLSPDAGGNSWAGNSWLAMLSPSDFYDLAALIPTLAICVRRTHDTGRSGWWALLPIFNLAFWAEPHQPGDNAYGPGDAGRYREIG